MRKYRVLWPHVGDKEYAIDDIRIADPNEVAHLVKPVGSMLEDIGEADEPVVTPVADPATDALEQMQQAHQQELLAAHQRADELSEQLIATTDRLTSVETALSELQPALEELRSVRDTQAEQLGQLSEQFGHFGGELEKLKSAPKTAGKAKSADTAD